MTLAAPIPRHLDGGKLSRLALSYQLITVQRENDEPHSVANAELPPLWPGRNDGAYHRVGWMPGVPAEDSVVW